MTAQVSRGGVEASGPAPVPGKLSNRESAWVLRRCARRGHVVADLADPISSVLTATGAAGPLHRCLRCGTFVDVADLANLVAVRVGSPAEPAALGDVPLAVRGSHGRKVALLRVLAVERGGRGLLLLIAALGIAQLSASHVAVAEWLGRLAQAAQPLGDQIGWDVAHSSLVAEGINLLGHADSTYTTIAWLVAAYGLLQITEGYGLWGGWRWAEYLAAVATTIFVPLEVYELWNHPTVLKAGALLVNLVAVAYLVLKGRLFGVRGGHDAYLAEVRDATLLADLLRRAGRPTTPLTSHHLV